MGVDTNASFVTIRNNKRYDANAVGISIGARCSGRRRQYNHGFTGSVQ